MGYIYSQKEPYRMRFEQPLAGLSVAHEERLGADMYAYTNKRGQLTYEWRVVIDAHIRFFHDVARFA